MKRLLLVICSGLIICTCLSAQKDKIITVKAGTRVRDNFPAGIRYRYPEFTDGQVLFKNGKTSNNRLNYNILKAEMEFVQSRDTLSIVDKRNINYIIVARDTFFYNNGYLEVIHGGPVMVGLKQYYKLSDVVRKGPFGSTNRVTSYETFNSVSVSGNFYDLVPNEDWVFQKSMEYYLSTPESGWVLFNKKNVMQLFPDKADAIKVYMKTNRVLFNSGDDLLRFADFLHGL